MKKYMLRWSTLSFWKRAVIISFATAVLSGILFVTARNWFTQVPLSTEEEVLKRLRDVVALPESEEPYIASITDRDRLAGEQAFFHRSQDGDLLIYYEQARLAILYRPDTQKIIALSDVNKRETGIVLGQSVMESTAQLPDTLPVGERSAKNEQAMTESVRIVVLNGSGRRGAAALAKEQLSSLIAADQITTGNTVADTYAETSVVSLNQKTQTVALQIAAAIDGSVADAVPDGESVLDADIVVILGTDSSGTVSTEGN